ncbi:MAG: hypothetical protein UGA93_07765 [Gemmiger formicilis]|uniref:hypothetical protein n=1 Tax=Gemmiger formicilis TaxID=745368 RepID=UPI002E77C072|nr:hypothetical protein [Gemmiger formicilis]MEE1512633.1 hypothetical protein [Gemmiger formicilis]
MRRNFAQILKEAKIDIKSEYQKLYGMLYDRSIQVSNTKRISAYDELSDYFLGFYFRGTCLSIEEFNNVNGFHFEKEPEPFSIDNLILLCEYIENMLMGYQSAQCASGVGYLPMPQPAINVQFYLMQIAQVIEKIGYMPLNQDGFVIYVEKSPAAISVAESEQIPKEISYKMISYNHHSMRGKLQEKKNTILKLAELLEAKRTELAKVDSRFCSDIFYLFNNLNIRHNNVDPSINGKFKQAVADMPPEELEHWYDETYQMCLLAFLRLEQADRKIEFDKLKSVIEST